MKKPQIRFRSFYAKLVIMFLFMGLIPFLLMGMLIYNVTIYSNSSVLGGETVIGENTIIGGNTFITASIPANTKVSAKSPELVIKKPRTSVEATNVWDWEN